MNLGQNGMPVEQAPAEQPTPQVGDVAATAQGATPAPTPEPAAAPAAQPEQKLPFWKSLLQGAMRGIAGSSGSTSFGGGVAAGAAGEMAGQQRDFNNGMQVRFANLQDAKQAADLTRQMTQEQHWNEEMKARNDELALAKAKLWTSTGWKVTPMQRAPDAITTFLKTNGGQVHPYTFNSSDTIFAVTPGEDNGWRGTNSLAAAVGAHPVEPTTYNRMTPQAKNAYEKSVYDRLGKMTVQEIDVALDNYKKTPNADPNVISVMEQQRAFADAAHTAKQGDKDADHQRKMKEMQERNAGKYGSFINPDDGTLDTMRQDTAAAKHAAPAGAGMKAQQGIGLLNEIDVGAENMRHAITGLKTPFTSDQQLALSVALQHKNGLTKFAALKTLSQDQKNYVVALNSLREGALSFRGVAGQGQGSDSQRAALYDALPNPLQPVDMQLSALTRFDQQRNAIRSSIPKVNNKTLPNHAAGAAPSFVAQGVDKVTNRPVGRTADGKVYFTDTNEEVK